MENNNVNNKGTDDLLKELENGFNSISKLMDLGLKTADKLKKDLYSTMTKEERSKYKSFEKKYNHLFFSGKLAEANELKEKYLNE